MRECIDPGIFLAGKTIAATLIYLLMQPEDLKKVRAEFNDRTGGRVGGTDWVAPLGAIRFLSTGGPALAGVRAVDSYTA